MTWSRVRRPKARGLRRSSRSRCRSCIEFNSFLFRVKRCCDGVGRLSVFCSWASFCNLFFGVLFYSLVDLFRTTGTM